MEIISRTTVFVYIDSKECQLKKEKHACRGPSIPSSFSFKSKSMSSHLLVPGTFEQRPELLQEADELRYGARVLPIRSNSFRDQSEIEKERNSKRPQVKVRSGHRRESSDHASDNDFYLIAAGNRQRRRSSLPASSPNLLHLNIETIQDTPDIKDQSLRRVRSFKTTTKGVVNRGDSIRKRGARNSRYGSDEITQHTHTSSPRPEHHVPFEIKVENSPDNSAVSSYYKVVILGATSVGKTSITQQFMTSEYVAFENSMGKFFTFSNYLGIVTLFNICGMIVHETTIR